MHRVRGGGRDPVAHGAGFVDAILHHLAVLRLLMEHQLVVVFGNVVLTLLVPDADLAEQSFHAEGSGFIGDNGNDAPTDLLVLEQDVEDAHDRHRGRHLAPFAGRLEQRLER